MFWPTDGPWYAGGFWGNQTQWTVVTLPTVIIAVIKLERGHKRRHDEQLKHLTRIHERLDALENKQ
jgi:hypothetical protein